MTVKRSDNDGFALPVAIFALVVLGVMVTGGFYIARQQTRIGVATVRSQQALYMAERGLADVQADFSSYGITGLNTWEADTINANLGDGSYTVIVTRVGSGNLPRSFFLDATGTVSEGGSMMGGATRRLGLYAKVFSASIEPPAALTTTGNLLIGGSAEIDGTDDVPSGGSGPDRFDWTGYCDNWGLTDKPGIMIDDINNVDTDGNPDISSIQEDPTLHPDSLLVFGDMTFADLADLASRRYTPGEVDPMNQWNVDSLLVNGVWTCDTGIKDNWGMPTKPGSACGSHFPIIYATGDMTLNGNDEGQGILLVEGDLELKGGFEFFGPVIVRGTLSSGVGGGTVHGGAIAANVEIEDNRVLGNAFIKYSTCAVERAVLFNTDLTQLRVLANRGWVDLSNITY